MVASKNILILLLFSLFIACSDDEFCAEPTESLAVLKFYSSNGINLNDTTVLGFSAIGINVYDSLLYDSINTGSFKLPYSATETSSSFILSFSIPDTLFLTDTIDTDSLLNTAIERSIVQNGMSRSMVLSDSVIIDTIPYYYYKYDTISFYYLPVLHFISQSCGFTYHYQIESVQSTKNIIDTILINSDLITTKGNENFKVLL